MVWEPSSCRKDRQQKVSALKSRNLNAAEFNYSTSEREALAIRWGIKKLRKYLLGAQQFRVITDHKPLQAMLNKTPADLPPRIEKFIMDVQEYEYVVEYRPGTTNIADYLSRHAREHTSNKAQETDEFARTVVGLQRVMVVDNPAADTIQEIREETRKDTTLTKLQQTIRTGQNEGDDGLASYTKQGFVLKHITSEWPRANGTVERFNRCMKEAIQAGHVEGKPMRDAGTTFLQSYRASPHTTTKKSPFAAMHGGREMQTK